MSVTSNYNVARIELSISYKKVGCLNRAGIKSIIMSTVSKTNMNEILDIIDAVVKANVKAFAFSRYVPTGGEVDAGMTPQEYRNLLEICDAKYKAYEAAGCETYFNKKDHLWTLYEYETGQFKIPDYAKSGMIYGGCNCGNCHITISSNGDVMACRRVMNSKVANVFEDRLADVWICQMEKYREYDKFTKCSKCELMAWCRGCPAVATVDSDGAPQIRNISAIHYEPDALYFFTARGKDFCKELLEDGRVQILCYTRYKEMIRLSGKAYAAISRRTKVGKFPAKPYYGKMQHLTIFRSKD